MIFFTSYFLKFKPSGTVSSFLGLPINKLLLFFLFFLFQLISSDVKSQTIPCKLNCRDTTICFNLPDSLVKLKKPKFLPLNGNGGTGLGGDCVKDSIWSNAPGIYPVGITYVTWYVSYPPARIDSCTMKVTRRPPSVYTINFTTSPPIVAGVINICNGQSITFMDNSTGISGLLWNFGNGYYSSNAVHTEPAWHYPPGTYYDTLTVYDDCGAPHDTAFTVVVDSASGPDIFCISVVCPGDTVTYHTSAICTNYTWTVTGGTFLTPPPVTSDSATVIWGAGSTGTISLAVSGCTPPLNCPFSTIKTVHIVPATLPIAGDTVTCAGSTTTYCVECIPGNNYSWELLPGNAGTVTGQGTSCITINWAPGFTGYATITLNYQNVLTGSGCNLPENCSHDNGCGGTATITVHVKPIFGITGPTTVCPNIIAPPFYGVNTTANTIEPGTTWKIKTPIPTILTFNSTTALNAYNWNAGPGNYYLTAYAPPNIYCNDSAFYTVTVVNMLIPAAVTGPDTVCAGLPFIYNVAPNMTGVTYTWNVTGGIIIGPSNGSSVTINWFSGGGTISVSQTLTASPGCTSASNAFFTVYTWPPFPLPVITPSNAIACVKSTIIYSIPPSLISNGTYTWSVVPATAGTILSANGTNQITIKWINASSPPIFVKLKISRCYTDSVMFPVNLLGLPPVPPITAPSSVCKGTNVTFSTTSPGPSWNWNFGDLGTANTPTANHVYTTAGDFNVQLYVTNVNGCSDTAFTKIRVEDIPQLPVITGTSSVCVGSNGSYTFPQPIFPGASYIWGVSAQGTILSGQGTNTITVKWSTVTPGGQVTLTVLSTCPAGSVIPFSVAVNALPTASISVPSPLCVNAPLTFTGSGGPVYNWNFPGGSVNLSNPAAPIVTYGSAGNYSASLNIVNVNGCVANTTTNFTVNPLPITYITAPAVCTFPATITLSAVAAPGYTFVWTPTGSTSPTLTQTLTGPATYSVVVTNIYGCTNSTSTTILGGICAPVPGVCVVNDSLDFISTPPVCLTKTFTKIYTGTHTGWNFGDGGTAGAVSPVTHTYALPGVYTVTIYGTAFGIDNNGMPCTTVIGSSHNVLVPFKADFTANYQCNAGNTMQTVLTNSSLYYGLVSNYTWDWYLDNSNVTFSTNPFPANQTFSAGPHTVHLVINDPANTLATCTLSVNINVPVPVMAANNMPTPVPYCAGIPLTFTDASFTSPTGWLWDFYNNGVSTSGLQNPQFTYPNAGSFSFKLTVSDQYGCNSIVIKPITIQSAGIGSITVDSTACDSVELTASGIGPFFWSNVIAQPVPNNPFYAKQAGYYSVVGYNPSFGCPYKATVGPLTIRRSPNATITGKKKYCQGEALDLKTNTAGVTIAWTLYPTGPVLATTPNLNIIAAVPGTFTYRVTLTAPNGCSAWDSISVVVDPVPGSASIVAAGPTTFCQGDSVNLSVNPVGFTYLWSKSPTPPLTPPSNSNVNYWATQSGTYSVIVQTSNGCQYPNIAPITITVNPIPIFQITGDTVVCEKDNLVLNATPIGGATYNWTGPFASGNTNPFIKLNMQLSDMGVYTVVVTNSYGCTASDSVNVTVNPVPPTPFIASNPGGVLCEGQLYSLFVTSPAGPPIVYTWNTNQIGISINAVISGDYEVTATNQFGCSATSNVLTIHPRPDMSCAPTGCYDFCNECDSVIIPGPAGLYSYTWQILQFNVFTFYSSNQNLTVFPPGGVYNLIGMNQWGCADSTDTLKVDFHDCCYPVPITCVDTCVNFNDNNLHGWQPDPSAPNVGVVLTNVNSQAGANDYYILASDQPGPSFLLAGSDFKGKWCCGDFCYDYRIFDDGVAGTINVNPSFSIFSGTLGFQFTSTFVVTELNGWHSICAPVSECGIPPVGNSGIWSPIGATVMADWPTVLNNVTALDFTVDFSAAQSESSGFDNVCIQPSMPVISAGADTTICSGSTITLNVHGCNAIPKWYVISGDSLILVGNGELIDITPLQSTCYVVICCGAGNCCCDSDTICVNVNPKPIIKWTLFLPSICLNGPPVYLDSTLISVLVNNNWVPISIAGGTGFFFGPNVIGNYFYPIVLGPSIVSYTYTDSLGCSTTVSTTIIVITCCDTSCSSISAGPDQTICLGNPAILSVTGCNSMPTWYQLVQNNLQPIGQGPILDVFPTVNTCYVVICCNPTPCCCDTDTVCITVVHPELQWPVTLGPVCLNAAPLYLDTANILVYVNNNWIPVNAAGGSGYFSGPNVLGYYFYPNTIGGNVITYNYTDPNGCMASVSITIIVNNCTGCDPTCSTISAGPDQTICLGNPAILSVTGCNSNPTWYQLVENNLQPIGQGPILDVFPTSNTCYVVICCNPTPCCCDTDTVCINVVPPPQLNWGRRSVTVCNNAGPYFLNAADIYVFMNNMWVSVPASGGSGYFFGPGVSGNNFIPPGIGTYVVSYYYISPNGCTSIVSLTIRVIRCGRIRLNVDIFLQGFYSGTGLMDNKGSGGNLYVTGVPGSTAADADSITITVIEPATLVTLDSQIGILDVDGHVTVSFNDSIMDHRPYFLKFNHRNSIETWTAGPIVLDSTTTLNFSDDPFKAFGGNLVDLGNGVYGLYSGDVDQNGIIDMTDFEAIGLGTSQFFTGYTNEDLTGDGMVESADYSMVENNLYLLIIRP